ncbi:MAG TPA: MBL fold metallo-hydrolase [Planctomycetota bacterium]|nr:MBL fold metallo-hydrolase [Planctomycetota bacterium]
MRTGILLAMAFVLGAGVALSHQTPADFQVAKVAGTVYLLTPPRGGNVVASVGDDGILVVDDNFAESAPKMQEALKGITDKPVKFVLNTHHHGDHTGGNELFSKLAPIFAHTNVRKHLSEPGKNGVPPKGVLPVVTFDDRIVIHVNGEDVRAVHYANGHTDGDIVVYFSDSNVVHMGDDFFAGRFPFIDLKGGGSVKGLIASVDAVIAQLPKDAKVVPGHGPLSTVDDLRAYSDMLKKTSAIVEAGMQQKKTLEQLKSERVLRDFEKLSWEFISTDAFLETLYQDRKAAR